uniref:Coiled-coil domain containing 81 n=1 Tax=Sinocyclocheilus anshuiensis TaxID=1608454 RepID=A0A671RLJ0_9TELE
MSVSFPTDIYHIWSLVSCFIKQQMFMRKGVYIFGLGTFTFCQQKLNFGNKHILIQRPVFILAEKLSHYYGFKQIKPQATDVPVGPLNFSALSAEGPFQRDAVERCVRETLHLLLRAAATRPSVSHAFPGIGVLTFRQSRVKMLFCRDFISALDGTGKLSSASASVSHSERDFSVFEPISRTNLRLSVCHEHRGVSLSIATVKSSAADASLDRACRDHRRAGQELCYVCMQRAQRTLPLYQSDESRAEREQERVLMLQEHQKDLKQKKREDSQKLAAFNLAAAEAQRRRKAQAYSQSDVSLNAVQASAGSKLCLLRAACEENWHRSADLKHQRDREGLNSRRYRNKLMIKQLGKYERCSQCKRSTANRGESNVFRDTSYVTGARLML